MIASKKDGGPEMTGKGTIKKARETVLAAGKSAAERTKVLAGEVANAAATAGATAKAASTAAASAVSNTVATAIQTRAVKGANALAGERATMALPAKKKVGKKVAAKKRAEPKKKVKTSRKAAKKK
jgi:histone H1/5